MTQPNPSATGNAEQERIKRGARVTQETRKRFQGTIDQSTTERVVVAFHGTENLGKQLADSEAGEAHLIFRIGHRTDSTDVGVLVFLNMPNANASTPTNQGFVGAVAFFDDESHGHGRAPFRLLLTATLVQAAGQSAITATFVPVRNPENQTTPTALDVDAGLQLVRSTVEPVK